MRYLPLLALALFTACAAVKEEAMPEPVMPEPVLAEPAAGLGATDCMPGDDDGIGGTGCEPD